MPSLTPLTAGQILQWADDHRRHTGRWPTQRAGPVPGAPGVTWSAVAQAMRLGLRGLSGGDSLALMLARERGARPTAGRYYRPALTPEAIVCWAEHHRMRTGRWPTAASGPVTDAVGETWGALNLALLWGRRGLPGGSSLSRLLAERRGGRRASRRPPLSLCQVLAWAEAHRRRCGQWPAASSGPILEAPGENWRAVNHALYEGLRGLPGGDTLTRLGARQRERGTA